MKRFLVRTDSDADKLVHDGNDVKQVKIVDELIDLEVAGTGSGTISSSATGLKVGSWLIFVYFNKIDKLRFLTQNLQVYATVNIKGIT